MREDEENKKVLTMSFFQSAIVLKTHGVNAAPLSQAATERKVAEKRSNEGCIREGGGGEEKRLLLDKMSDLRIWQAPLITPHIYHPADQLPTLVHWVEYFTLQ